MAATTGATAARSLFPSLQPSRLPVRRSWVRRFAFQSRAISYKPLVVHCNQNPANGNFGTAKSLSSAFILNAASANLPCA